MAQYSNSNHCFSELLFSDPCIQIFCTLSTAGSLISVIYNFSHFLGFCLYGAYCVCNSHFTRHLPFLHFFLSIHFYCEFIHLHRLKPPGRTRSNGRALLCHVWAQVHCRVYGSIPLRPLSTCLKCPWAWILDYLGRAPTASPPSKCE